MAAPTKQYGLILSQKKGLSSLQKHSVFEDDSDDETTVGESLQKEAIKKKTMKQTRLAMHKALEEDSTVYDYDGVYDDIKKQRLEASQKLLGGADKKPKYIHQLMRAVEDRKKEQERRDERKIQKERVEEGEQFADKDAYVTSAYKLKLQEQKEEQEKEKRMEAIEAALDVKKQKDLSGFYRHLLNQTVGEEAIPDGSANKTQDSKLPKIKTERTSPVHIPPAQDVHSSGSDSEEGREQKSGFSKPGVGSAKRQYRQRSPSSGSGEEREKERERHKKRHRDQERDRNRGRERDDRHGGRRDDRDGRRDRGREDDRSRGKDEDRDRDRDRGREDDRSRGKDEDRDRDRGREDDRNRGKDADREDRHGKRERSPKEREKDRNGDREKRRNHDDDRRKDKDQEAEKEGKKQPENEKAVKSVTSEEKDPGKDPEKDPEEKEAVGEPAAEKSDEQKEKGGDNEGPEEKESKFVKRSTDETVTSARDRYMSRHIARSSCKTYIEKEED